MCLKKKKDLVPFKGSICNQLQTADTFVLKVGVNHRLLKQKDGRLSAQCFELGCQVEKVNLTL